MPQPKLLRIVVLLLAVAAPSAAEPTAREILSQTILGESQVDAILAGEKVTTEIVEVSDRELAVGLACLVPPDRRSSLAIFRDTEPIMPEKYRDASGPIDPDDIEGSLAALALGKGAEGEAKRYLGIEPGYDLNLSREEMERFRALQPERGQKVERVEATLRDVFAERIRSYRAKGLDGIAPFARGKDDATGASPAGDLRNATEGSEAFRKVMPGSYGALLSYPDGLPPEVREYLFWTRIQVLGRPVFLLNQRLTAVSGEAEVVIERQFYASHFLNVGQTVVVLLPVREGTIAFYANRTWVDKWHGPGFTTSAKRGIGKKLVADVLSDESDRFDLCEGLPRAAPPER